MVENNEEDNGVVLIYDQNSFDYTGEWWNNVSWGWSNMAWNCPGFYSIQHELRNNFTTNRLANPNYHDSDKVRIRFL